MIDGRNGIPVGNFPAVRMRRLRRTPELRGLVRETHLQAESFILPLFLVSGSNVQEEIPAMPGQYHLSCDRAVEVAREAANYGVNAVLLFGLPEHKDAVGRTALDSQGPVARGIRAIKQAMPQMTVITDVCLCEYTDHGHCGVIKDEYVDNDATLKLLASMAVMHAKAGADMVAPSDMMDGHVAAIRQHLDQMDFPEIPILGYSAKYASAFYGPFREAANSAPQFGDRRSYQMDPANRREALQEVALDVAEGVDAIMVKPALAYLDVLREVRDHFPQPLCAYNVSGEYSMVKAAASQGWIDERRVVLELLTSIRRAGADMIITYHAIEAAKWLAEG